MHKNEIIVIVAVLFAVGFRLYRKYANKEKGKMGNESKQSATSFPSSSKDEDYEPYSKK
jgi:hypothetical protein